MVERWELGLRVVLAAVTSKVAGQTDGEALRAVGRVVADAMQPARELASASASKPAAPRRSKGARRAGAPPVQRVEVVDATGALVEVVDAAKVRRYKPK